MKRISVFLLLIITIASCRVEEKIVDGNRAFERKQFANAIPLLKKEFCCGDLSHYVSNSVCRNCFSQDVHANTTRMTQLAIYRSGGNFYGRGCSQINQ